MSIPCLRRRALALSIDSRDFSVVNECTACEKSGSECLEEGKFQKLLPSSFRLLTLYHRRDTTYGYNSFFLAATEPDKQSNTIITKRLIIKSIGMPLRLDSCEPFLCKRDLV